MFSTLDQLNKKTGPEGVGRYEFLSLLVDEFRKTKFLEAKSEVLANLSNFAYDPINFEYIRRLHIVDLFLEQLSQNHEDLLNYALAGICNLSTDPENREYIIRLNGIFLISQQLLHHNEEIALNAITTLLFLITPETQASITSPEIICKVLHYLDSSDQRFKNLGTIFLKDFCTLDQISFAKSSCHLGTSDIPLPY